MLRVCDPKPPETVAKTQNPFVEGVAQQVVPLFLYCFQGFPDRENFSATVFKKNKCKGYILKE
jgi:hypothetical protein